MLTFGMNVKTNTNEIVVSLCSGCLEMGHDATASFGRDEEIVINQRRSGPHPNPFDENARLVGNKRR
jgi:hypothetical protein